MKQIKHVIKHVPLALGETLTTDVIIAHLLVLVVQEDQQHSVLHVFNLLQLSTCL